MAEKGKRKVESVEYRQIKGGIVSETRHKIARGGQGGGPEYDYEREEQSHPTIEHAQKHLAMALNVESGKKADSEEPETDALEDKRKG